VKILGIIPARKGSKGIKNKNIINLGNMPLIEYTFSFTANVNKIDKIILSTDSDEIIKIAERYTHIDIPFTRPDYLCTDEANVSDVAIHALDECNKIYKTEYTHIALFQPTSPFRIKKEIDDSINELIKNEYDSIFSVNEVIHHPSEYITINDDKFNLILPPKSDSEQRQLYDSVYFINGSFYMCSVDFLKKNKSFLTANSKPIIFSKNSSFDIDDDFDLMLARNSIQKDE
tara:strand:+ start:66 stop:758 length:693 start_codon:yes stop_codon:yes gene_type:complete